MNLSRTLSLWVQTVDGGLTAWEVASIAVLFVRWVVSHFPEPGDAGPLASVAPPLAAAPSAPTDTARGNGKFGSSH